MMHFQKAGNTFRYLLSSSTKKIYITHRLKLGDRSCDGKILTQATLGNHKNTATNIGTQRVRV